jgi:hypothetical protein
VALRRLSTSSIQTNGKSSKLWDQTTFQSGMFAIATVTLTTTSTTVVFDNIPANYTHLQIRGIVRSDRSGNAQDTLRIRYNSDSGTNYASHHLEGNGSIATYDNFSNTATPWAGIISAATATSGVFGGIVIDILDYASTSKAKVLRSLSGLDNNDTNGRFYFSSSLWTTSNAAISKIELAPTYGTNFVSNTSFALYGIKAA